VVKKKQENPTENKVINDFINEVVKNWITDNKWLKKPATKGEDNELQ
jgi:hypothetical protein